jgi:CO/xanthine dehydrogenase Mo-binding subunit
VYAAAYALSAAAASATTTFNKNASPSKLYREYGQMIGAGFALGMDDSQALVARSAAGMLAAPGGINRTASGSTPIGIGGSTTINHITQTITVPAANFKEWLETVEFVQTLDTTRQMHFGAH